ncbi:uncharacterized protein LOC143863852 [Tasmannia lanceolata]|uniref:uncharacterized protein LOC143863852 n=1 Tax=Tasmannia lanceolata TaxID=3420 RepID=UPI00406462B0
MAASRLLLFRTSSFFHICRKYPSSASTPPSPLPSLPIFPTLQYRSCASSSAISIDNPTTTDTFVGPTSHPWLEWPTFLDCLKSKGYFEEASPPPAEKDDAGISSGDNSGDAGRTYLNSVKSACLSFGRDRSDILRSLSKKDIQAVVECGCPNLFRKAVSSAKRLRAYVKLDEGNVCSACNLRGSCDKAYATLKDDEGARTVDIVRILLNYAIEPLILSEGVKSQVRGNVEASSRKLLSELIELSDTSPDPSLPKDLANPSHKKEQLQKVTKNDKQSQNVEMKRGDWICSKCNFMNFSRNIRCLECKEDGPKRVSFDDSEMKKGDWTCPKCQFMNFSRNAKCLRCQEARPRRQLNPGEWECPSCDFVNFRRNMTCKKCNCKRPKDGDTEYEDQMQRKPKVHSHSIDFVDDVEVSDDEISSLKEKKRFAVGKRKTPSETAKKWN